jgi:hypothetical protein
METAMVLLFGLASFLASLLLFLVEPMIGKMVLPPFGGTPAVWNTCLVFFQGTLLGGYLFAGGLNRRGQSARWRGSYLGLSVLAALLVLGYFRQPIAVGSGGDRSFAHGGNPAVDLLGVLLGSAALPLVLVSATGPLVQGWLGDTRHPRARDPYFLYAASNAGSLLGLFAYPFVIEPYLGLGRQSILWSAGFVVMATLVLACGVLAERARRSPLDRRGDDVAPPAVDLPALPAALWLAWLALVFIPSSWLLGVTAYLTTDLAPIPLMWIMPLALYLVSFMIAFARPAGTFVRFATWSLPFLIAPLVLVMMAGFVHLIWIPLHLLTFFAGSLACHGGLARMRPATEYLTRFYVFMALGGLLGGIWTALVAPLLFNRVVEYPLALVLASLVAPGSKTIGMWRDLRIRLSDVLFAAAVFVFAAVLATNQAGLADSVSGALGLMIASGLGILSCATAHRRPVRFAMVIGVLLFAGGLAPGMNGRLVHIERNFFGVVRVTHDAERNVNRLFHGSTLHGQQSLDPEGRREPSTYFTRSGPIGQLWDAIERGVKVPGARMAIVGLGAGTLASSAAAGERWTFYEIDDAMERIARDPRFFTYLADCKAESVEIILGDARQRLRDAPDRAYRMLVLDAFSSDALPVHLLSRQAIGLYRSKLADGGVLVFNLSNRYLDLDPVIGRQAHDAGMACRVCYDLNVSEEGKRAGKQPSIWAVMAINEADLGSLATDARWQVPRSRPGAAVWTDDYSDLASYLRWMPGRPTRAD